MDDEKKNLEVATDEPFLGLEPTDSEVLDGNLEKGKTEPTVELVDELPNDIPEEPKEETRKNNLNDDCESDDIIEDEKVVKKRRISVFIFIILGIMLAIAVFGFFSSLKEKTPIEKFAEDFKEAKNVSLKSETNMAYKRPDAYDAKNLKITFSASSLELPAEISGKINIITTEGDEIFLGFDMKLVSVSEFYLKFSNLENFLDDMNFSPLAAAVVGKEVYSSAMPRVENEWVKIDAEELSRIASMFLDRDISESDISACLSGSELSRDLRTTKIILPSTKSGNNVPLFIDSDKIADLIKSLTNCFAYDGFILENLAEDLAVKIGELPTFYLEAHDQDKNDNSFTQVYSNYDNSWRSFSSLTDVILEPSRPVFEVPENYLFFSDLINIALGESVDE